MTGWAVFRAVLGLGLAAFLVYAGRRYERTEWEIVAWENGNLREANEILRDKYAAAEEKANEKSQKNAKLRQALLAYKLQSMRDRN